MELRYQFMVLVGLICIVALGIVFLLFRKKKNAYKKGIRVANTDLLTEEPFFKRKILAYRILKGMMAVFLALGILFTCVLMAQPYIVKITKENKYCRDILICLDVSTSVDELNKKLVKELEDTVKGLDGERVGIVIFNTSPVLLAPLTDDYEYIIEQLENIRKGLAASGSLNFDDDWLYWDSYLYSGTLIDNDVRGSSLIGDGLLSAALNLSGEDKDRTRIIIFSTDNEKNGDGYVTLPEAAEICKENNIIVYGIGTKNMYKSNMKEMKRAVELTGGSFYLEENAGTFYKITEEIEAQSANLVKGKTVITNIPHPEKFFAVLVICVIGIILCAVLLRQIKVFQIICRALLAVLLIAVYITVVRPAKYQDFGEKHEVKTESGLQVLFVIDDTISMLANDADKQGTQRIDAAQKDCAHIIEELEGARFAVINFHNYATLLSPYTSNSSHVQNTIDSMYPIHYWYANGSSLNTPRELMFRTLKDVYEKRGKKTAVFFLSDGEITDSSSLESYSELSRYVDGGAVIGYGTKKGGTMTYIQSYSEEESEILDYSDYSGEPAVSKIDVDNLRSIARDLGISYVSMQDERALNAVLADLKKDLEPVAVMTEDEQDETGTGTVVRDMTPSPGYYLLILCLLLLLTEGWIFVTVQNRA